MPQRHRWAIFCTGAWLAITLVVATVAAENFYTIDRLLAASPNQAFRSAIVRLGEPQARDLLRYLASELNRLYFVLSNGAQLTLGVLILCLTAPHSSRRLFWSVVAMLGLVIVTTCLAPEIIAVGRSVDFVPRNPEPPTMQRFWLLHGTYTTLEGLKLALGAFVAVEIARGDRAHASSRVAA
jgi:hypothetical protein